MPERIAHTSGLQQKLWDGLKRHVEYVRLNGPEPGPRRNCTNLNLSIEFIEGEGLALALDLEGIAVASGPSCVSHSLKISPVLTAIGLGHSLAQGNVILSLGRENTAEEIDFVVDRFAKTVARLRNTSPMWDDFQRGLADSLIQPRDARLAARAAKPVTRCSHS